MASSSKAIEMLESLLKNGTPESILEHIHNHKILSPSLVLKTGLPLLKTKMSASQRLTILEQITISALHEKQISVAQSCLTEIRAKTGKTSLRYRKLLALCLECEAGYEQALEIYDAMIKDNEANIYALKRKYCILRGQLNDSEARKALNDYLEKNASDAAGWVEMANTCLENGDYHGAAFCYEEVVLFSPTSASVHCTLGELYVTMGGKDNYALARKHFAQCLELDKGNIRAMYGLISATENFLEVAGDKSSSRKSKGYAEEEELDLVRDLKTYGITSLTKAYRKGGSDVTLLENIFTE